MSTRMIVGAAAFCVATSGAVLANMFLLMMVGEINRTKGVDAQESYFGYSPPKMLRVFREYRARYPDGRLAAYSAAAFALVVVSAIVFAVCIRVI